MLNSTGRSCKVDFRLAGVIGLKTYDRYRTDRSPTASPAE